MTHTCDGYLTIIGSDNGLSPGRRQAITWTNVGILLIGPLGTNFSMLIDVNRNSYIFIQENPFENVVWKMAAILSRPQCVNVEFKTVYCELIPDAFLHVINDLISSLALCGWYFCMMVSSFFFMHTYCNSPSTELVTTNMAHDTIAVL